MNKFLRMLGFGKKPVVTEEEAFSKLPESDAPVETSDEPVDEDRLPEIVHNLCTLAESLPIDGIHWEPDDTHKHIVRIAGADSSFSIKVDEPKTKPRKVVAHYKLNPTDNTTLTYTVDYSQAIQKRLDECGAILAEHADVEVIKKIKERIQNERTKS